MISGEEYLRIHPPEQLPAKPFFTPYELYLLQELRKLEAQRLKEACSSAPWFKAQETRPPGNKSWELLSQSYLTGCSKERLRELSIQKGLIP